jgi:hypothetical protein
MRKKVTPHTIAGSVLTLSAAHKVTVLGVAPAALTPAIALH